MSFQRDLVSLIRKGDTDGVIELLTATPEKTRREVFETVRGLFRETRHRGTPAHAASIAVLGCGNLKEIRSTFGWIFVTPRAADVIAARPKRTRDGIVKLAVENEFLRWIWPAVHELVKRGEIPRPDHDGYLIGLLLSKNSPDLTELSRNESRWDPATPEQVADRLRREPDLVDLVFEAFRIDEGQALWASQEWIDAVPLLVATGDIARDRVLDEALAGHLADLRPTATKRYRELWESLEPTNADVGARLPSLVKMIAANDRGAQKLALAEVTRLAKAGELKEPAQVIESCRVPLNGTQKNLATAALRLVAFAADTDPQAAVAVALVGLGHPRPDIQEASLDFVADRIDALGDSETVRAELLGWTDAVAPQLQSRVRQLTGIGSIVGEHHAPTIDELIDTASRIPQDIANDLGLNAAIDAARSQTMPQTVSFDAWNPGALARDSQIEPIEEPAELVDVLAAALSGSADGVDLERALDGLSRFAAKPPIGALATTLRKHVQTVVDQTGDWALANLPIVAAANAWVSGQPPAPLPYLKRSRPKILRSAAGELEGKLVKPKAPTDADTLRWLRTTGAFDLTREPANFEGMGLARTWEVGYRCAKGLDQPLLAFPTHRNGWITPKALLNRLVWFAEKKLAPDRFDACQAILRLAPLSEDRVADAFMQLGTPVALAAGAVLGRNTNVRDEGLRRATERTIDLGVPVTHLVERPDPRHEPVPLIQFPDAPAPAELRRDDPVGVALSNLRTPPERAYWWNPNAAILSAPVRSSRLWATTMPPRFPDLFGASVAAIVIQDLDANRTSDVDDLSLAALVSEDVPLGIGAHTGLAVALSARNDALGTMAVDLLSQAGTDGRLDPAVLGRLIRGLVSRGLAALNRSSARMGLAAESSPVVAEQCRRAFAALVGVMDEVPRDIHHALEAWLAVASGLARGVVDPDARRTLEEIVSGGKRSKRTKLAAALLGLPQEWTDATPELLALEAQLERARRWKLEA